MAAQAKESLIGMSELELETCLGLPDQKVTKGPTTIFTYNATAARTLNVSLPIVSGIGMSFAGYCHATFRLENGRVMQVNYSGDSDTIEGKDSICGSIVRACLQRRS